VQQLCELPSDSGFPGPHRADQEQILRFHAFRQLKAESQPFGWLSGLNGSLKGLVDA
jgi:hypothetical protein